MAEAKAAIANRLARRWDNLSIVRSRFRKGKPWLRTISNTDGDLIIDTPALVRNHPILKATLECCGDKVLSIDEMVKEVGRNLNIFTKSESWNLHGHVFSSIPRLLSQCHVLFSYVSSQTHHVSLYFWVGYMIASFP